MLNLKLTYFIQTKCELSIFFLHAIRVRFHRIRFETEKIN